MRYTHLVALSIALLLFAALPAMARSEACGRIDKLAKGWDGIAETLDSAGAALAGLNVSRFEKRVIKLLDPTEEIGLILLDHGSTHEQHLGDMLLEVTDELYEVQGDELTAYLDDTMDDIVEAVEDIVEHCGKTGG